MWYLSALLLLWKCLPQCLCWPNSLCHLPLMLYNESLFQATSKGYILSKSIQSNHVFISMNIQIKRKSLGSIHFSCFNTSSRPCVTSSIGPHFITLRVWDWLWALVLMLVPETQLNLQLLKVSKSITYSAVLSIWAPQIGAGSRTEISMVSFRFMNPFPAKIPLEVNIKWTQTAIILHIPGK